MRNFEGERGGREEMTLTLFLLLYISFFFKLIGLVGINEQIYL